MRKDIHQPLFFCWFFNLEVGTDGDHFSAFAMVDVVSSSGCKLDKPSDTVNESAQAPGGFVADDRRRAFSTWMSSVFRCTLYRLQRC